MKNSILNWAVFFGASGVILGALGAHALKDLLSPEKLLSFETGVRYQLLHSLFLLGLYALRNEKGISKINLALKLCVIGIFCFSFSIYILSLNEVLKMEYLKILGPITPIGGILLISAWIVLLFKNKNDHEN